jgi:cytochrome c oxidase accessory protein FixG
MDTISKPSSSTPELPDRASQGVQVEQVISLYAKQKKIYPKTVSGWFNNWRWVFVWLTQLVFYGLPWLEWNDRQAVLFDLSTRNFYIFGLVFYPQDLIYLTGLLIICAYGLFLFTAVAGRLWCGFACPQTVYTEIYLWIERQFEGDRLDRMRLDEAPWSWSKIWRKSGKQTVWILVGLWTGFTFVGYFTPIQTLMNEALSLSFGPWEWFWVLFYGFATYGNAGYMREQVCKYMCPYARFQSVMFDRDTLTITYDAQRGEPRGSRPRSADPQTLGKGSCIDCGLCVQVCPTGIDIRNGLQQECIGCAACIDVCDDVMDKMNYPRGLIRYDTENVIKQVPGAAVSNWKRILRPRVMIYTVIMVLITSAFVWSLAIRGPYRVDVFKDRGALARQIEDGKIENVYTLRVMNATEETQRVTVQVTGVEGIQIQPTVGFELASVETRSVPVAVQVPFEVAQGLKPGVYPIQFVVEKVTARGTQTQDFKVHEKSTFIIPR